MEEESNKIMNNFFKCEQANIKKEKKEKLENYKYLNKLKKGTV